MKDYKRILVTSALPYANGPLHIGHLAGVYVPSDIFTRYQRLKGNEVLHICGSDEHGVPITIKARQEGKTPQQVVDKYHEIIKNSFNEFGISFNIYSRTSNKIHHDTASGFFRKLYEENKFIEKISEQYFDIEAGQFLADRYITGICPHCSNENAYGDQCEKCGTSLSPTDLINPRSTISGNKPVLKETKHWFLPLDKYEGFLTKWILDENKHWKANVYGQCKSWIDQGLQPRAVSRDLDWGVPLPIENAPDKVLYVWFDAPIGYISATKELTSDWEKFWKDEQTRLVHFIGKDNIVFHCIIFPVMLKAEGSFILPENVPANEFLNLEGDKISTSRNWAVWLHEYLEEFKNKQDVLRYVLCANAPETKDNDFTWKDFQARNNNELVAIFGNFVNRTFVLTHNYFEGKVPDQGILDEYDRQVLSRLPILKASIESFLEQFKFREALKEFMNIARLGNKYLADTEPWNTYKLNPERVKTNLNIAIQICGELAVLAEPFLPFTSKKLKSFLNLEQTLWEQTGKGNMFNPGHQLKIASLLFDKIEDSQIEKQIQKLLNSKKANQMQNQKTEPQKENISYEAFSKMDIRVGTILEAEHIAKTKKLMKLKIDTGIDVRTVVSGIAEHFEPTEVIGKQVSIFINLEPREIRGIESKGMILMAENPDGKLVFISPLENSTNGSTIK